MIKYSHILHLLTHRCHDGTYVNGHPEICEWLDNNPEPHTYIVEQLADELGITGYHNVRIWSSVEAQDESIRRRTEQPKERPRQSSVSVIQEPSIEHPLVTRLYEAVASGNLQLVVQLKQECRNNGIKFDRQKTDIRRIGNLPNI